MKHTPGPQLPHEANARLIAATSDLLEACKQALSVFADIHIGGIEQAVAKTKETTTAGCQWPKGE